MKITTGSCLCGGVNYETRGPLRAVIACHCIQCRKTSGHHVAATQVPADAITIHGDTLTWYRSSDEAERGFCCRCGGNLFWRRIGGTHVSIFAGTIDGPTGVRLESQLYTESAGDYYALPDVPIIEQSTLK
jgi:hypothetical protein